MSTDRQSLVVLTGPVGGGKSSTAAALAAQLRVVGPSAANIDLDVVYGMARQRDGFGDEDVWKLARRGAAALADVFFRAGVRVVVVEGGVFDQDERDDLVACLGSDILVVAVTLQVSFDRTLLRVQSDPDPGRVASRNPELLRWLHDQYVAALPYLTENSTAIDADQVPMQDVVDRIAKLVLED